MQYELFYLIGVSKEAELPEIKKEVEGIVETAGGKFLAKETLEKRRLSYQIKHENHGIYLCRRFELEETENLAEVTKNLNLNVRVMRFLISKASELPELKSKEERMEEAAKREKSGERREVKPAAEIKKTAAPKVEEKVAKEKSEIKEAEEKEPSLTKSAAGQNEDIDKKLEEILNI